MATTGTRALMPCLLALALLAGACSDDDGSSGSGGLDPVGTTDLDADVPLDDWVDEVNGICAAAVEDADLEEPGPSADPDEMADFERDVGDLMADVADEIDDVGAPDDKAGEAEAVSADLELLAGLFDEAADAIEDNDVDEAEAIVDEVEEAFDDLLDVIDELGIDDCATVGTEMSTAPGVLGPAS